VVLVKRDGVDYDEWIKSVSDFSFAGKHTTPEDYLRAKRPGFKFDSARVPAVEWVHMHQRIVRWLGHAEECRAHDTIFAEFLVGYRGHGFARSMNVLEYWDGSVWHKNVSADDLEEHAKADLTLLFGTPVQVDGRVVYRDPSKPLEDSTFLVRVAKCLTKYTAVKGMKVLDSASE